MSLYTRVMFAFRFFTLQLRHGNINTHNTHQANGDWAASCFFTGLVRLAVSLTSTSHFSYTHTQTHQSRLLYPFSVKLLTHVWIWKQMYLNESFGRRTDPRRTRCQLDTPRRHRCENILVFLLISLSSWLSSLQVRSMTIVRRPEVSQGTTPSTHTLL